MKKGWEVKGLAEVCRIVNGGTPKSKIKNYWGGIINWITPADLGKLNDVLVGETSRKITDLGLKKSSAKLFPENSVILSTRAPIGHLAINTVPMSTNQGCRGIVPNANLNTWFLFYFLKGNIKLLNQLGTGTTFLELSTKNLASVEIPLPPLAEQKAIVAKLDQAFKTIDQAKANVEQNIANAEDLFQSQLNQIFSQTGDGWEEKKLGEVCEQIFAGGDKPKENFSKEKCEAFKIPIFANAVKSKGLYGYTDKARVMKPALTIAGRGSGTGHTELRRKPFLPIVRLIVCIPDERITTIEFLKYSIDNLILIKSGSAIPQLTVPMIKTYKINLPSLAKQNSIIDKLDLLQNKSFDLKSKYQQKLESLEELKQSILEKAFKGELV